MRDITIDRLRGIAMLHIMLVHVIYWGNLFSMYPLSILKSFLLWEMPLLFFVTGAGNSKSEIAGYWQFIKQRFLRILIPYWVYAFFCVVLTLIASIYSCTFKTEYAVKVIATWAIPLGNAITSLRCIKDALWFIPVYLGIMLLFPMLLKCRYSKYKYAGFFCLFLIYLMSLIITKNNPVVKGITFYALWTYLGLFYDEIKCHLCGGGVYIMPPCCSQL